MSSIANDLYEDEKKHSKTKLPLITHRRPTFNTAAQ
jgi:hypothetical protein